MPFSASVSLAEMQLGIKPFKGEILGGLYVIKLMTGRRAAIVSSIQQSIRLSTEGAYHSTCSIFLSVCGDGTYSRHKA